MNSDGGSGDPDSDRSEGPGSDPDGCGCLGGSSGGFLRDGDLSYILLAFLCRTVGEK